MIEDIKYGLNDAGNHVTCINSCRLNSPNELEELRKKILSERDSNKLLMTLSSGTCGRVYQSEKIATAFIDELGKQGLKKRIGFREAGCFGFCERNPWS